MKAIRWLAIAAVVGFGLLVLAAIGSEVEDGEPGGGGAGPGALSAAVADIQDFWRRVGPEFADFEYAPLPDSQIGTVSGGFPTCDGYEISDEDVEGNAVAASCEEGVIVVYDDEGLLPELEDAFGPVGPAVVLAHEFGHAAQFQSGALPEGAPTVLFEQQADCLAGAWAADAAGRGVAPFGDGAALDGAVGAIIEFRDEPGTSAEEDDAHGLGFDRVAAFQDGFEAGVARCATYRDDPPELTQVPFSDPEEAATGGNLPFDEVVPLAEIDLNRIFGATFGLPPLAATDAGDEYMDALHEEHEYAGDGATVILLAVNWTSAAMGAAGEPPEDPRDIIPLACGAGAFTRALAADDGAELAFSPGDLDEGIVGLADLVWDAEGEPGLVFEAVASFRSGIAGGFGACGLG